jgi:uncharacterized protein YcbK (DUF882 family)
MNCRVVATCVVSLLSVSGTPVPAASLTGVGSAERVGMTGTTGAMETWTADYTATSRAPFTYIIEQLPPATTTLTLHNVNNDDSETFSITPDGHTDAATTAALKHFLRCRRTQREKAIATGTLSLLVSVAQHWPGRVIDIVSGFRAPPFGAPHSKHFAGHAIDLRVEGVRTATVRDFVWRGNHEVGVGLYTDEDFVHIDWRPGEADRAWSSRNESDELNYNPRWAWSARHPQAQRHGRTSPRS